MTWMSESCVPIAIKMNAGSLLKESVPLALFFLVIAILLAVPNGTGIWNVLNRTRSKTPALDHSDMYLIRPHSSDDSHSLGLEVDSPQHPPSAADPPLVVSSALASSDAEIRNSLVAAKDLVDRGKLEKADKVYQRILALHPEHPDVLTAYGEFFENGYEDVVQAEHLYTKALIASPAHETATERRRRTLPLVEKIDQRNFDRISDKQKQLQGVPRHNPGLRRAKIEAYVQHIYHTNAMEGNTMTLMQTRAVVETGVAVGGKSVFEHNEILGMDAALQYINKTFLHQARYIGVDDILEIHKRVLGFVNMEEAGRFRQTQVFVGSHRPPAPGDLDPLVQEFVEWLNSEREEQDSLHPLELAALAHYKFVFIHPFYDGNGRVSRLIMNLILMQAGYPPVIINVEDKHEYYQTLQKANDGDIRPFIRFVADCTERTLDHYLAASSTSSGMSIPGLVSRKASRSWTFTTARSESGGRRIVPASPMPSRTIDEDDVVHDVVSDD